MFQQWKLIFQKTKLRNLIFVGTGIFLIVFSIGFTGYSCGIQHMLLIKDISVYGNSLDPEFCEKIIDQIDLFNENCEPEIEILDCG